MLIRKQYKNIAEYRLVNSRTCNTETTFYMNISSVLSDHGYLNNLYSTEIVPTMRKMPCCIIEETISVIAAGFIL